MAVGVRWNLSIQSAAETKPCLRDARRFGAEALRREDDRPRLRERNGADAKQRVVRAAERPALLLARLRDELLDLLPPDERVAARRIGGAAAHLPLGELAAQQRAVLEDADRL